MSKSNKSYIIGLTGNIGTGKVKCGKSYSAWVLWGLMPI